LARALTGLPAPHPGLFSDQHDLSSARSFIFLSLSLEGDHPKIAQVMLSYALHLKWAVIISTEQ
jgi:hypothetical protein